MRKCTIGYNLPVGAGNLLHRVFRDCARWEIKVELTPYKLKQAMAYYTGNRIVVSTAHSDWLTDLAHEFAHAQQDQSGLWQEDEAWLTLDRWLAGKRVARGAVEWATLEVEACELDAERRSRRLLDHYEVDYDKPRFIMRANQNVFTYELQQMWRKPVCRLNRFQKLNKVTPKNRLVSVFPEAMYDVAEELKDEICQR